MADFVPIHDDRESELIIFGASELELITDEIERVINFIEKTPSAKLRDIAYTACKESENELVKVAVIASSIDDLKEKLDIAIRRIDSGKNAIFFNKGVYIGTKQCPVPGRLVFLFPGEGSQYPDMLRNLTLHFPICRSAFDDADTACARTNSRYAPSQWIFPAGDLPEKGIAEEMGMATAVQSVIAADTALLKLFTYLGIFPDAVAGVGIGEIAAMEASGAIEYATRDERIDALSRGYALLSELPATVIKSIPHTTTFSVAGIPRELLENAIAEFNGETVIVREQGLDLFSICSKDEVFDAVCAKLSSLGATIRILPIKLPYHTPWVAPLIPKIENFFNGILRKVPEIPVYSFTTTQAFTGENTSEWAAQIAAQWKTPVKIRETIDNLYNDGFRVFVELGARGALASAVTSTLHTKPHLALAANRGHRPDILQLNHVLAILVSHGAPINIDRIFPDKKPEDKLDFSHPGQTHLNRPIKTIPLPTRIASMRSAAIPHKLIAAAPITGRRTGSGNAPFNSADDGLTAFPLLGTAEIIKFAPEQNIDIQKNISTFEFQAALDASLSGANTTSTNLKTPSSDKGLRGILYFPLDMALELMAESAGKLYSGLVVVAAENLTLHGLLPIRGKLNIRIMAKCLSQKSSGEVNVEVVIYNTESFTSEVPEKIASANIILAQSYSPAPPEASHALRNPLRLDWEGEDLYPARLYYGPSYQNIHTVHEWGENGLHAECIVLPRRQLISDLAAPRLSLDPILTSAAASSLAAWDAREPASGSIHIGYSCQRIDFYSPPLAEWTKCGLTLFMQQNGKSEKFYEGDVEISDPEHRVIIKASGWKNRIIRVNPKLHNFMLHPDESFFTEELPKTALASVANDVVCCAATVSPGEFNDEDGDLRLTILAYLMLSSTERTKWDEMVASTSRKTEWLFGRLAAKDAVRSCLHSRYGRKWRAADIRIETDESGKPSPQGEWRSSCGAHMDISITHTVNEIVAAAAPNASLGIDIEKTDRGISEEFARAAFSPLEQEIAAESGDCATTLFRFWCAKEALSKALGTGLRFGPADLCARAFDTSTGIISMEVTHLWLQSFPQLKGKTISVQSATIDNLAVAICILPPEMAKQINSSIIT